MRGARTTAGERAFLARTDFEDASETSRRFPRDAARGSLNVDCRRLRRVRMKANRIGRVEGRQIPYGDADRKSTRLNSSHSQISYAVFCLKKKKTKTTRSSYLSNSKNASTKIIAASIQTSLPLYSTVPYVCALFVHQLSSPSTH